MKKLFKPESILFVPEIIMVVVLLSYAAYSCTSTKSKPVEPMCKHNTPGAIMLIPADTVGGRPTYSVIFDDEKALDHMYGEEIGNSLATGKWEYDEDLVITTEK